MRRFLPVTIWLAAVFPVLSLWRRNFDEVDAADVVWAGLVALGLGSLVWGVCRVTLKQSERAVVAGVAFLVAFFGWAPSTARLQSLVPHPVAALAAALAGILVLALAVRLTRRPQVAQLGLFVGWLTLLLVVWEVIGLSAAAWQSRSAAPHEPSASPTAAHSGPTPPDIYFILLDGYARADVMQELYGYDNTPFLDDLRHMGFHVSMHSRSNYVKTLHALSSILNMAYVQELVPVPEDWQRSKRLVGTIQSNRVVFLLRKLGYTIHSFDTGYSPAEFSNPDYHYVADRSWSEFHGVLLRSTPLPLVLGERGDLRERHRRRLRFVLDKLPDIHDGPVPRFVFAHLLAPHPPFVFDRNGDAVDNDRPFGYYDGSDYMKRNGTVQGYRHDYAEQARYVSQRISDIVHRLLQQAGDRPPIILLLSDHGPGSGLDWSSLDDTDLHERFGILFAVFLPGYDDLQLEDDLSPVNAFRMIFDLYFGTELGPLEARSYYTWQSQPFHYFDVTDPERPLVHRPAPQSGLGR